MNTNFLEISVQGQDITYDDIQKIEDFFTGQFDAAGTELSIHRKGGPGCNTTLLNLKIGDF